MMQLQIRKTDLAGPWILRDRAWRNGQSFIAPYDHPAIESFALEARDCTLFVVRERAIADDQKGATYASEAPGFALLPKLLAWPLNFQIVQIEPSAGRVRIHASGKAAAPLFVTSRNGPFQADWDVARLYATLPIEIDFEAAAFTLGYSGLPYSCRTIFAHVQQLTERATAQWDSKSERLSIHYPEPLGRSRPREVHPEADIHGAFATLFGTILQRVAGNDTHPVAFEISGGLDSGVATIIGTHALGADRVRSFGLLLPGDQMEPQRARRDAIARHCGIADIGLIAEGPLSRGELADLDPIVPWGEYYRESFLDLSYAMRGQGCRLLVRGLGGDEISELRADEIEPDTSPAIPFSLPNFLTPAAREAAEAEDDGFDPAPAGAIPSSFCQAAAASTPVYLRRGIWPIYPYGDPEIVDLCRSLPVEWRRDRHLQRSFLRKAGMPDWVVRPAPPESFLPLRDMMFQGKSATFVAGIFGEPILGDLGLVEPKLLQDQFEQACRNPELPGRTHLLEAATLECMLRSWRGASEPLGP